MQHNAPKRCRLVLIVQNQKVKKWKEKTQEYINSAIEGGDIAAVIFEDNQYGEIIKKCMPEIQKHNIACVVIGNKKDAEQNKCDGFQCSVNDKNIKELVENYQQKMIVGVGDIQTRHQAMVAAECEPDYIMIGSINDEKNEQAKIENMKLAKWYAQWSKVPCIVVGDENIKCVDEIAKTQGEFVALASVVFNADEKNKITKQVKNINQILDQNAPKFDY